MKIFVKTERMFSFSSWSSSFIGIALTKYKILDKTENYRYVKLWSRIRTRFLYASCGACSLLNIFENGLIIVIKIYDISYFLVIQTGFLRYQYLNFDILSQVIFHLFTLVNQDEFPHPGSPGWTMSNLGGSGPSRLEYCSPWWTRASFLIRVHPGELWVILEAPDTPDLEIVHPGEPGRVSSSGITRVNYE